MSTPDEAREELADSLADVIAMHAVTHNPHGLSIPIDDAYKLADNITAHILADGYRKHETTNQTEQEQR